MAGSENTIKTRLTLDGEKEFKRQIAAINQELRLGDAQLRETAAAFDLNGNAQEKLASRSKILKEQLDAQNRIVEQYENRLKQAKNATDMSAQGIRNYEIALTGARTKQKQLEKKVQDTDRELEELGRDSRRAGNQLEQNLGDAAEDVENKFERMASSIKESLEDIRGMQGVSLGVDIVRGAWDVGQQLYGWWEGNQDYNMRKSQTMYNYAQAGGMDQKTLMENVIRYTAVFGDEEGAMEAMSNLAAAGLVDDQLENFARYIGGLGIMFRDTYKVESLAEEARKTLETGKAEGQFAEALTALGVNIDKFNEALTSAVLIDQEDGEINMGQRYTAMEAFLRGNGEWDMGAYWDTYIDQNAAMIETSTAALELKDSLAELSNEVGVILTPVIKGLAEGVKWVNEQIDHWTDDEKTAGEKIIESIVPTTEEIKEAEKTLGLQPGTLRRAGNAYAGFALPIGTAIMDWIKGSTGTGVGTQDSAFIGPPTLQDAEMQKRIMIATGELPAQQFGDDLGRISSQIAIEMAETAGTTLAKAGTDMVNSLSEQTGPLVSVAEMQRSMLEAVWADPITPTVVVGYSIAKQGAQPAPTVATTPPLNVIMKVNQRELGRATLPAMDAGLAGDVSFNAKLDSY